LFHRKNKPYLPGVSVLLQKLPSLPEKREQNVDILKLDKQHTTLNSNCNVNNTVSTAKQKV